MVVVLCFSVFCKIEIAAVVASDHYCGLLSKHLVPPPRLRPRQARPPGSSACLGGMGGRAVAALCVFGSGSAHPTARRPCTVPSGSALLSSPQSHPRGSGRFCLAARLFPPSRREGMAARQSRPLACAAPSCPPHLSVARHGSLRFGAVSPAAQSLAPGPAGA